MNKTIDENKLNMKISPRLKLNKKSIRVNKGDLVEVMVGNFKGKRGRVSKIMVKKGKIHVEGVVNSKKNGKQVTRPIDPSNCSITELNRSYRSRKRI